jgi:hypothetical protein
MSDVSNTHMGRSDRLQLEVRMKEAYVIIHKNNLIAYLSNEK